MSFTEHHADRSSDLTVDRASDLTHERSIEENNNNSEEEDMPESPHPSTLAWTNSGIYEPEHGTRGRSIGVYRFRATIAKSWRTKIKLATDPDETLVSLKCVAHADTEHEMAHPEFTQYPHTRLLNEVRALQILHEQSNRSPHIIKFIDFAPEAFYPRHLHSIRTNQSAAEDPDESDDDLERRCTNAHKRVAMLVTEYAPHRDMIEFIRGNHFSEALARTYFVQLVKALKSVHGCQLSHCNIRPENLLLSSSFNLKLSGFGEAVPSTESRVKPVGIETFMAPEVAGANGDAPFDGCKADVWSAGITLLTFLIGHPIFQKPNVQDPWFRQLLKGEGFWDGLSRWTEREYSQELQTLVDSMLKVDPNSRIAMDHILEMEWSKGQVLTQTALEASMKALIPPTELHEE